MYLAALSDRSDVKYINFCTVGISGFIVVVIVTLFNEGKHFTVVDWLP